MIASDVRLVAVLLILSSRNGPKVLKSTDRCSWPVAEEIKLEELDFYIVQLHL